MTTSSDDWDYENPEVHHGRAEPSAVYTLRFPKAEIVAIRAAAKAAGVSTSEFIRRAAREKAATRG